MMRLMGVKRFLEWIGLKQKLDASQSIVPKVSEGQIWWASLGENVGYEINGKSQLFTRPVIIFKKLARGFYFVVPTTTQQKIGTWYLSFNHKGVKEVACLHQARSIDYRRLYSKLGELDHLDYVKVADGLKNLYFQKCSPPLLAGSQENPESS